MKIMVENDSGEMVEWTERANDDAPPVTLADEPVAEARWTLGLGDCIEGMRALADDSVDVSLFDAPYSEHVHANAKTNKRKPASEHKIDFVPLSDELRTATARQVARVTKRWAAAFCDEESAHLWRLAFEAAGLEYIRTGRWIRLGTTPQMSGDRPAQGDEAIVIAHRPGKKKWNGHGRTAIYSVPLEKQNRKHATQKPLALMEALVRDFTDYDDLILDPFAGFATTGVAALRLGRRFVGFELDAKYHADASARLAATREQIQLFSTSERRKKPKQLKLVTDAASEATS